MPNTILQAEHISKSFAPPVSYRDILRLRLRQRPPVIALDDLSLSILRGKVVGILGRNGAGKTTLLKIFSTLILPDRGTFTLDNKFFGGRDDTAIKSRIGFLSSQERSFYARLTGRQNLEFFSSLYGLTHRQTQSRLKELLTLFDIDYADRAFNTYSAGMKQRFCLLRALLHDPDLLLLDEPTKSLDYTTAQMLRHLIRKELVEKQGKTVLLASHLLEEIIEICDLFVIMHKGRIRFTGACDEGRHAGQDPKKWLAELFKKHAQ